MIRHRAISLVMLFAAAPLFAQQTPPPNIEDRVKQLEQRLDTLNQQMTAIRQELDMLKSGSPAPAAAPGAAEDLTKVDVAQAPAASAAGTPPPSIGDVTTINNPSDPG